MSLLTDGLFDTYLETEVFTITEPFIRIDLMNYHEIRTVIIDRTHIPGTI